MTNDDAEMLAVAVKAGTEQLFAPMQDLLQRLFGPAAEVRLSLADSARAWRQQRQLRLFQKVKTMIDAGDIAVGPVPPRLLFPILEAASLEDDEDIQSHWAGLLVNAGAESNSVHPSFIEILRQLTSEDAQLLDKLYDSCESKGRRRVQPWVDPITYAEREKRVAAGENPLVPFQNLIRLGLIETEYEMDKRASEAKISRYGTVKMASKLESHYVMTEFAVRFVQACRAPEKHPASESAE